MVNKEIVSASYEITGIDGSHLRVSETPERDHCIVSIMEAQSGNILTCRLNKAQFKAFCDLDYSVEITEYSRQETRVQKEEPDSTEASYAA